ncbi:hypothetical protein SCLCIDRAFT_1213224 [Scleroderma citrinum Foug A]|uniref:Transcription factor CBF/NF-Y/archaeal histone domain-containing protein n=1 Tax=Scleroderma citrinum Foug A TaxID=1036808 RepID=A0A0C3AHI6_9AGAM|nr:hypothetical protein SCLCIDRAFT_1213224 [Scleroderma citrinum Foug A]
MQKDEEVGKVAQATPIVISKALELFLAMIVEESSKVTVQRGAKKVEAYHLKHAVETTEMFDFLKEIVEAVPDPSAGGTIDLDAEAAGGEGAKKKRASKARKNGAAAASGTSSGEPKRRRKRKGTNAEAPEGGATEQGGGTEAEGDAVMDEDEDREGGESLSNRHRGGGQDGDWQDDEDTPYVPR